MSWLETLPQALLDRIIRTAIASDPGTFENLLSVSKAIHDSTCRSEFSRISLADASPSNATGRASALLANPARYGPHVKSLCITAPSQHFSTLVERARLSNGSALLFGDDFDEEEDGAITEDRTPEGEETPPMDTEFLTAILSECPNVEELRWSSSCPPPDGICEASADAKSILTSNNLNLREFTFFPPASSASKALAPKWDAPSLPLLSSLSITTLELTRLSHTGAKAFTLLLHNLTEEDSSVLESLALNFVWLDDALCERVVPVGKKIKTLKIGTAGTKLTDAGIITLLSGLDSLQEFAMVEVEGRLSRTLWSKISSEGLPKSLRKVTIGIADNGPTHSWSLDHLQSLTSFPFSSISDFSIIRTSRSPFSFEGTESPEAAASLLPVPKDLVKHIQSAAKGLKSLDCDWWSWSPEDVKGVLESCSRLQTMRFTLDAPFPKLLSLASSIASPADLQKVVVIIPSEHSPSPPQSPSVATPGTSVAALTPGSSPIAVTGSLKMTPTPLRGSVALPGSPTTPYFSQRRDSMTSRSSVAGSVYFDSVPETAPANSVTDPSPLNSIRSLPYLDPALPISRDMKKLFKRCPALREVEWVGRGSWHLDTSGKASKTVSLANIKVEFAPPSGLSESDWNFKSSDCMSSAEARLGYAWDSDIANEFAKEWDILCPEKEKEKVSTPEAQTKPTRPSKDQDKRRRATSASTSSGSTSYVRMGSSNDSRLVIGPGAAKSSGSGKTKGDGSNRQRSASTTESGGRHGGHAKQRSTSSSAQRPNGASQQDSRASGGRGGKAAAGRLNGSTRPPPIKEVGRNLSA